MLDLEFNLTAFWASTFRSKNMLNIVKEGVRVYEKCHGRVSKAFW